MKNRKVLFVFAAVVILFVIASCSSKPATTAEPVEESLNLVPTRVFARIGSTRDYYAEPAYGSITMPDGTSAFYIEKGKSPWWYDVDDDDVICIWFDGFEGFDGDLSDYSRITVDVAFGNTEMSENIFQFGSYMFIDEDTVLEAAINADHLYWWDISTLSPTPFEFVTSNGVGGHLLNPFTAGKKLDRILFFFTYKAKDRDDNGAIYLRNLRLYK